MLSQQAESSSSLDESGASPKLQEYHFQKPKDENMPTPYLFITNLPALSNQSDKKQINHEIYATWFREEIVPKIEEVHLETVVVKEAKLSKKKKDKIERKKLNAEPGTVEKHPTMQLYVIFSDEDEAIRVKDFLNKHHEGIHVSYADLAAESKEQRKRKHVKGWNIDCTSTTDHVKIPGLIVIENFISEEEEKAILEAVDDKKWFYELQRRVQHYGYKFDYDIRSIDFNHQVPPIPSEVEHLLPRIKNYMSQKQEEHDEQISKDEFLSTFDFKAYHPDQLTINEYEPGQGIRPHIDVHSPFNDGLCIISMVSSCVMYFSRMVKDEIIEKKYVDLPRRSLAVMVGESRYAWRHAVMCREFDRVNGKLRRRQRRVSLTIRSVRQNGVCNCKYPESCDSQQDSDIAHNLPYSQTLTTTNLELEFVQKTYNEIASHWDQTRHTPWPR